MVFKRKNIHFNIFRPKTSSVDLNFFTRYISLYIYIYIYIYKFIYIYIYILWEEGDAKQLHLVLKISCRSSRTIASQNLIDSRVPNFNRVSGISVFLCWLAYLATRHMKLQFP